MTLTEPEPQLKTKATANRNGYGEPWDAAYERIQRERPTTAGGEWVKTMPLAGLLRLIGDIDTVGITWGVGTGAGPRTNGHTAEVIKDAITNVFRDGCGVGLGPHIAEEYTSRAFVDAFRYMAGQRTLMQLSRRTGIHRNRIHRLLSGAQSPSGSDMEAIAGTFGKKPWYFREYRSTMIAAAVMEHLDQEPNRSAAIVREIAS